MNSQYFVFMALDLARQRAAEADAARRAGLAHQSPPRASAVRRAVARLALAVARAADDEVGRVPLATC